MKTYIKNQLQNLSGFYLVQVTLSSLQNLVFFKNQHPEYLFHLIPVGRAPYATRNVHNLPILKSKQICLKNPFFRSTISEWNKLNPSLRNSESFLTFKKNILQLVKLAANSVYNFTLITQLRLGISHLRKHMFKHNFQKSLNPLCNCGHGIESTTHFFYTVHYSLMKDILSSLL